MGEYERKRKKETKFRRRLWKKWENVGKGGGKKRKNKGKLGKMEEIRRDVAGKVGEKGEKEKKM